jgi:hypothetical protein
MMLGIILPLVAFYIFTSIFSDSATTEARWKIFVIALIATFALSGISASVSSITGALIACCVAGLVSFAGLTLWIRVTKLQALQITGSYLGFVIVYSIVTTIIFAPRTA